MGTAALLKPEPNPGNDPPTISILDEFKNDAGKPPLEETINLPDGKVHVKISSLPKPGSSFKWIRIEALGTYVDGSGKEYTGKGSVWYRADNPAITEVDNGD
jgi:hypothetical protein